MKDLLLKGAFGKNISLATVTESVNSSDYSTGINVVIDSDGGSLVQAILVTDYLLSLNLPLLATGVKVASAATWVFLGIADRTISPEASDNWLFIHKAALSPSDLGEGTLSAEALRDMADRVDQFNLLLVTLYADSFGITAEEADRLMTKETWLSQEQTSEYQITALLNSNDMNKIDELLAMIKGKGTKAIVAEMETPSALPEMGAMDTVEDGPTLESLDARIVALELICSAMEASYAEKDTAIMAKDEMIASITASAKSKDALLDSIVSKLNAINEAELKVTTPKKAVMEVQSSVLQRAAQVIHNQNK